MRKPTICICENKDADQLRSNCEADQRLCFRYTDSTIPPLLKSGISRFYLFSVTVQAGLYRTWSETTLLVFPRGGSNHDAPRKAMSLGRYTRVEVESRASTHLSVVFLERWSRDLAVECLVSSVRLSSSESNRSARAVIELAHVAYTHIHFFRIPYISFMSKFE